MSENTASTLGSRREIGAFEFLELFIYGYAVFRFGLDILRSLSLATEESSVVSTAILGLMFLLVIARNYIVMQSIDHKDYSDGESYKFIDQHRGFIRFLEKTIRFLIVFVVVITPKHSNSLLRAFTEPPIEALRGSLEWLVGHVVMAIGSITNRDLPHMNSDDTFHDTLGYYGSLLFILFVLFLLWDIVNVHGVRRRIAVNDPPFKYQAEKKNPKDSDYFSIMLYLNVYRLKMQTGKQSVRSNIFEFSKTITKRWHIAAIRRRRIFCLYFWRSPKFRERAMLLAFSLSVILCSLTEASVPSIVLMSGLLVGYFIYARRNRGYGHDFWNLVCMFPAYFRTA